MQIDPGQVQWDPIDPAQVQWDDSPKKEQSLGRNIATGAARGFNDVVGTLGRLVSKITPDTELYRQQRQQFDSVNKGMDDAAGDSLAYRGSRVGGQIAATLPVGGAIAAPLKALSNAGVASSVLSPLASAISTGGLRSGGVGGIGGIAARTAGGAISGAATAGAVDPDSMGTGAVIGAVLPNAMRAAGEGMRKLFAGGRAPALSPEMAAALKTAQEAGYVVPPSQASPTLFNRALEGMAGKVSTAQAAAQRNQGVTNDLAATALGLPKGTALTPEALDQVRATAGKAYGDISKLGAMDATGAVLPGVKVAESGSTLLNNKAKSVDAGEIVQAWKQANADATAYYRAYGRDANPETLTKAKAAASVAKQIDDFLSKSLESGGKGEMMGALKEARRQIAKTYSVEGAMNAMTGTIDARKLAAQLQKGKPLSGELKQIADFAGRFPKAAQPVEQMGSLPGLSPLDWATAGGISAGAGPVGLLSLGARPLARSAALSKRVQGGLLGSGLSGLDDPTLLGLLGVRSAPLLVNGQ